MSPELQKVAERARNEPDGRFHSPAPLIDERALRRAVGRQRANAAVGVDGITKERYERNLTGNLYGFPPKRSAHDAIRALHRAADRGECNWILEADMVSCFDSVDRTAVREMLRKRLADGSLLRLIGKCLHVGVLDGAEFSTPDVGTAQGSILSPLLGNIYLHYALDEWFETIVRPRLRGQATLIRYADDFVIGFELCEDADRVWDVLPKRMGRLG